VDNRLKLRKIRRLRSAQAGGLMGSLLGSKSGQKMDLCVNAGLLTIRTCGYSLSYQQVAL
jgi:uncharacterized membrane protein YebE (DUF533 family)